MIPLLYESIHSFPFVAAVQLNSMADHVSFILLGFFFVVIVLATLSLVTSLIGTVFRNAKAPEPEPDLAPAPQIATKPAKTDEELIFGDHEHPEHIPAILAAAVHNVLSGKPHRIVNIRGTGWAEEGRRQIFRSHKFR